MNDLSNKIKRERRWIEHLVLIITGTVITVLIMWWNHSIVMQSVDAVETKFSELSADSEIITYSKMSKEIDDRHDQEIEILEKNQKEILTRLDKLVSLLEEVKNTHE